MFIQTEITPNPLTLKFIPGRKLIKKGTAEFKSSKEAESFDLQKIFLMKVTYQMFL